MTLQDALNFIPLDNPHRQAVVGGEDSDHDTGFIYTADAARGLAESEAKLIRKKILETDKRNGHRLGILGVEVVPVEEIPAESLYADKHSGESLPPQIQAGRFALRSELATSDPQTVNGALHAIGWRTEEVTHSEKPVSSNRSRLAA